MYHDAGEDDVDCGREKDWGDGDAYYVSVAILVNALCSSHSQFRRNPTEEKGLTEMD